MAGSTNSAEEKIPVLLDMTTGKPGCVLLQALMGPGSFDHRLPLAIVAGGHWVLNPTKDMRVVHGTLKEWELYADLLDAGAVHGGQV